MIPELPEDWLGELEKTNILVLVCGTLTDGTSHYAYVSIPMASYINFKAAEAKGNYRLEEFGTILAHGEGETPTEEVQLRMEREYGANHLFEDGLAEMLNHIKSSN